DGPRLGDQPRLGRGARALDGASAGRSPSVLPLALALALALAVAVLAAATTRLPGLPPARPAGAVTPRAAGSRPSMSARKWPVWDSGTLATTSGGPSATTRPPPSPPSGPR